MTNIAAYRVGLIALAVLSVLASPAAARTSESSWVLEKGQGVKSIKNSPVSLLLNDKQISGSTGCNMFRATLSDRADNRVAISDVGLTRKLCGPPVNDNERAIVQAFSKTEYIEEAAGTLTFLSRQRQPLLVWKQAMKAAEPNRSLRVSMFPPIAGRREVAALSLKEAVGS